MNNRNTPAAYVRKTQSGIEIVSGYMRLRGTLDVLHSAVVEDTESGKQFEARYAFFGGPIVLASEIA